MAGVLSASLMASAEEDLWDEFVAPSPKEHGFASVIADDRNRHLRRGEWSWDQHS